MTHEEVVARLASTEIRSYRQLPALVYHIQTKFRDELRSRGGLIRVREFQMKDSYSLDRDPKGLVLQYDAHYEAYGRIGARVGLSLLPVQSDVGMMGGAVAHEFMYVTSIGEDSLAVCPGCGYAANRDVARFDLRPETEEDPLPLEKVHTPGAKTIAEVCDILGVDSDHTGKMVFYVGTFAGDPDVPDAPRPTRLIVCVVRGDMEVNPIQVQNLTAAIELRPAHEEEILEAGMVPGAASPIGIDADAGLVLVDELVAATPNLVLGANESDYHLRNVCCGRDYDPGLVGPIAAAFEGAPCAACGTGLELVRGVEVGNIFQLGTKYSEGLEAFFTDEDGSEKPIYMGSYGIGLGRLLACVAEEYRDERGLRLPISVAPYQVNLVSLARSSDGLEAAERVFTELLGAGFEVLYDDRDDASAGVKLNDADLRGLPLRVVIGERSLKRGGAELKRRTDDEARVVALGELVPEIRAQIEALEAELALDGGCTGG